MTADAETVVDLVSRGGVYVFQQGARGIDAAVVLDTVGSRGGGLTVGPYMAALVHGDPERNGVRPFGLYWSDGVRNWSVRGGVSGEDLVAFARSLYC